MAIIREIPDYQAPFEVMMNLYPDQFLLEDDQSFSAKNGDTFSTNGNYYPMPPQNNTKRTKESKGFWKINMDYFYTVALAQYNYQRKKIVRNYEIIKGILTPEDFYAEGPVVSFMDTLMQDVDLPAYVKHYDIISPFINALVGEQSKRPDVSRPKAMDADSQAQELKFYTDLYTQLITEKAKGEITKKLMTQGVDTSNMEEFQKQVEQLTEEQIKEYKVNYTSEAEIWASNMLNVLKVEFHTKEIFEEGFRDLIICNREFFHIYETKDKTGFTVDCLNAKNVWWLTTPDKKYTKDAYAAGIIEIMELSEVLNKYKLSEEEINHLRAYAMQAFFPFSRESQVFLPNGGGKGIDSIRYNTYDPLIVQERNKMESMINNENTEKIDGFLGNAAPSVGTFGNRFVVTTAYWISKVRVGLLTYIDKDGVEQSQLVDDHYKDGEHPQQISIEWDWKNQWYKGVKIGDDIYIVEPLTILDYCPIIGVSFEIKNATSVSKVDQAKPLQTLFNVCMNQVYRLLEKEKGKVLIMNKRFIPLLKGDDAENSIEIWERKAEETQIIWIDDSPENLKGQSSFNQFGVHDMTNSQQIDSRLKTAEMLKDMCMELGGVTRQRLGGVQASETATGTNTAMAQSYAQTEPLFAQHEYLINQVLQSMIDVAQYIECKKPESTLSYINNEGGNAFVQIQTESGLKNRDIKLFITSRAEDQRILQKLQELSQAALQNGASLYEVSKTYTTTSVRQLQDIYKKLKEQQDQVQQQQQQSQQQQIEGQQAQQKEDREYKEKQHQEDIQVKIYEIDTKANTDLTIANIKEKMQFAKTSGQGEPDILALAKHNLDQQIAIRERDLQNIKLEMEKQKQRLQEEKQKSDDNHKQDKLDLDRENMQSRERMNKENLKARKASSASK